jgi:hypothetical protein
MKSDYNYSSIIRRDFRQSHDEPEVPRWRKKRKHVDKARCKHEYTEWTSSSFPQTPRVRTNLRSDGYKSVSSTTTEYQYHVCKRCHKRQARWRNTTKYQHFHWEKLFFEKEYVTEWKTRW